MLPRSGSPPIGLLTLNPPKVKPQFFQTHTTRTTVLFPVPEKSYAREKGIFPLSIDDLSDISFPWLFSGTQEQNGLKALCRLDFSLFLTLFPV